MGQNAGPRSSPPSRTRRCRLSANILTGSRLTISRSVRTPCNRPRTHGEERGMTRSSSRFSRCGLFGLDTTAPLHVATWRFAEPRNVSSVTATPVPLRLTDAQWRKRLLPQAHAILRQASTKYPVASPLNNERWQGTFSAPDAPSQSSPWRQKSTAGPAGRVSSIISPMPLASTAIAHSGSIGSKLPGAELPVTSVKYSTMARA